MKKTAFADRIIEYAIDYALDELGIEEARARAKLYRKAGLELIALGAQVDAESRFGV